MEGLRERGRREGGREGGTERRQEGDRGREEGEGISITYIHS